MTLKEITSEMMKPRNLSTIIERKKEEFDDLLNTFQTASYWDGEGATDGEPKVAETKAEIESFFEKAIRESVEEALREVESTALITEPNEFESWVKEFMK